VIKPDLKKATNGEGKKKKVPKYIN
jgi:hypothetical protein